MFLSCWPARLTLTRKFELDFGRADSIGYFPKEMCTQASLIGSKNKVSFIHGNQENKVGFWLRRQDLKEPPEKMPMSLKQYISDEISMQAKPNVPQLVIFSWRQLLEGSRRRRKVVSEPKQAVS